jgi:hypothetical protein
MTFRFSDKRMHKQIYGKLNEIVSNKASSYFAPSYHLKYRDKEDYDNGWTVYQHFLEFIRLGVDINDNKLFSLYIQEINGAMCDSYPNFLLLPAKASKEEVNGTVTFRCKKRLPVLCWLKGNATIWRSAQTKSGFMGRNSSDENYLEHMCLDTNKLHIYDARPYLNALANKMKGAGFENTDYYKNSEISFCEIENIHFVRAAYAKVRMISQLSLYLIFNLEKEI